MCTMQYFGHAYTKIIQLFIVFCVATLMGVGLGRRGRRTREKKKTSCWENQRNPGFWAPNLT